MTTNTPAFTPTPTPTLSGRPPYGAASCRLPAPVVRKDGGKLSRRRLFGLSHSQNGVLPIWRRGGLWLAALGLFGSALSLPLAWAVFALGGLLALWTSLISAARESLTRDPSLHFAEPGAWRADITPHQRLITSINDPSSSSSSSPSSSTRTEEDED